MITQKEAHQLVQSGARQVVEIPGLRASYVRGLTLSEEPPRYDVLFCPWDWQTSYGPPP